jgi:hypothetical protein
MSHHPVLVHDYPYSPCVKGEHRILISILKRAKPPGIGKRLEGFKHIPLKSLNNARVNAGEAAPHIVPLVIQNTNQTYINQACIECLIILY